MLWVQQAPESVAPTIRTQMDKLNELRALDLGLLGGQPEYALKPKARNSPFKSQTELVVGRDLAG